MEVTVPSSCQQCCGVNLLLFVGYSFVFVQDTLTLANGDDCTGIAGRGSRSVRRGLHDLKTCCGHDRRVSDTGVFILKFNYVKGKVAYRVMT